MTLAPDRIYGQYRDKPKAVAWYNIVPTLAFPICNAADQVKATYDIETQEGAQLDVLGNIIRINRTILFKVPVVELGDDTYQCADEDAECAVGSLVQGVNDELFRLLLRAKIIKNTTPATIDDLIRGISFILTSETNVVILDNEDMSFSVQVDSEITEFERDLIAEGLLIPKPQGVRFLGLIEILDLVQLGDDEFQCGDSNAECAGFTII